MIKRGVGEAISYGGDDVQEKIQFVAVSISWAIVALHITGFISY